jgi:tetratricopeptide (TPR) repeat protein
MTDILVRSYIYVCLRVKAFRSPGAAYCDECSRKAAFELALCYKIGFGVRKNDVESQIMLDLSKRRRGELEHEMFKLKHLRHEVLKSAFRSDTYKEWILQGHIPTTEFAQRDHDQSSGTEQEYRREITDMESSLGDTHVLVNALRSTLSKILMDRGLWKRSEELLIQVLKIRKTILGVSHPHTMTSSANLACVYREQGRWKEAEDLFAEIVEISLSTVGPQHPDTLQSMELLALTFSDQGRWEEAEKLYLQALRVRQEQLGVEHPKTLKCMRHLASTFLNQGRWEEAEKLYLQVLRITQELGAERPVTLRDMASLAKVFVKQERWEEAAKMYLQIIDTSTNVLGTEHPNYAKLYDVLSRAMRHFTNLASGYNPPPAGTVVVLAEKHLKG